MRRAAFEPGLSHTDAISYTAITLSIYLLSAFNSASTAIMALGLLASSFAQVQNEQVWFLDSIIAISIAFVLFVYGSR